MDEATYYIVPTNGRPCLRRCLDAIRAQTMDGSGISYAMIVEGGPDAAYLDQDPEFVSLYGPPPLVREPELNISRWWNLGLALIASYHQERTKYRGEDTYSPWNVAIINDDVILPEGWAEAVSTQMRAAGAAAACSGAPYGRPILHTKAQAVDLRTRMQGFAFMLAGEKGVRANEQLKWWFGDDMVDWLSRERGGMLMIPGYDVQHLYPNGQMTPEMHEQTAHDAAAFKAYWGRMPW